jgi:hypothetical protein
MEDTIINSFKQVDIREASEKRLNNDKYYVFVVDKLFEISEKLINKSEYLKRLVNSEISKKDKSGNFILHEDYKVFKLVHRLLRDDDIKNKDYDKYKHNIDYYLINEHIYPIEFENIRNYEKISRIQENNRKIDLITIDKDTDFTRNRIIEESIDNNDILYNNRREKKLRTIKINKDLINNPKEEFLSKIMYPLHQKVYDNQKVNPFPYGNCCDLDFSYICIAGGSVINSIINTKINDLDIFLVIPKTYSDIERANIADNKITYLINYFHSKFSQDFDIIVIRSLNCISIHVAKIENHYNNMYIKKVYIEYQIILRIYDSINEILLGFDLDSCCFAFDGNRLLSTKRGLFSLKYGINMLDFGRYSLTYRRRLRKYALRGFGVYIPFFKRKNISFYDFIKTQDYEYTLAKLIVTENSSTFGKMSFPNLNSKEPKRKILWNNECKNNENENESDYSYSYAYSHQQIPKYKSYLYKVDFKDDNIIDNIYINTPRFETIQIYEKIHTFKFIITKKINSIKEIYVPENVKTNGKIMIPFEVTYVMTNPGRQFTTSFNPKNIDIKEWYSCLSLSNFYNDKLERFIHETNYINNL